VDITHAHNILGAAHLRDGNYEKANEHFEKCLQKEEALEHLPGMATSFYNPGLVACQRGGLLQGTRVLSKNPGLAASGGRCSGNWCIN